MLDCFVELVTCFTVSLDFSSKSRVVAGSFGLLDSYLLFPTVNLQKVLLHNTVLFYLSVWKILHGILKSFVYLLSRLVELGVNHSRALKNLEMLILDLFNSNSGPNKICRDL